MVATVSNPDGRHDFHFLHGTWNVANNRLKERLAGSTEWEQFSATTWIRPLLGGSGQIEEMTWDANGQAAYGVTLRVWDPATDQWSLHWVDSGSGRLFPPMVGSFGVDGVGIFVGMDMCGGKSVLSRFVWSGISETTARWEQAFSGDGGVTWETNWVMEFVRVPSSESLVPGAEFLA